jgi:hypothetical protein
VVSHDHEDLIDTLRAVLDTIDERALQVLREAVAAGADRRPEGERHLAQARRALDKAIHALERAGEGGER